jgi:hypothetical protein
MIHSKYMTPEDRADLERAEEMRVEAKRLRKRVLGRLRARAFRSRKQQ